jgi:hypothetical protein
MFHILEGRMMVGYCQIGRLGGREAGLLFEVVK